MIIMRGGENFSVFWKFSSIPRFPIKKVQPLTVDEDEKTEKNVAVFAFPDKEKDLERWRKWVRFVNRKDFVVTKCTRICEKHFEQQYIRIGIRRLSEPVRAREHARRKRSFSLKISQEIILKQKKK